MNDTKTKSKLTFQFGAVHAEWNDARRLEIWETFVATAVKKDCPVQFDFADDIKRGLFFDMQLVSIEDGVVTVGAFLERGKLFGFQMPIPIESFDAYFECWIDEPHESIQQVSKDLNSALGVHVEFIVE